VHEVHAEPRDTIDGLAEDDWYTRSTQTLTLTIEVSYLERNVVKRAAA
jgi:hypothetical protein